MLNPGHPTYNINRSQYIPKLGAISLQNILKWKQYSKIKLGILQYFHQLEFSRLTNNAIEITNTCTRKFIIDIMPQNMEQFSCIHSTDSTGSLWN